MEGAPKVLRGAEVVGVPPARFFSVLVSGLMLPGDPIGNKDGSATLQSHFLGPPAALEQRCREAAGTRVWGSRATLKLREGKP